ncbi:MAG: hypothetical protein AABX70_00620 [Nanoarchaeota archaeon]
MNPIWTKLLTFLLIFLGEGLAIYAELIATKNHNISSQPFLQAFLKMFPLAIVAGGLLIAGYILGYKSFKNIWIVSALSITSILIIEPILDYTLFSQLPTKGAFVGLILGVIGFIVTLIY